MVNLGKLFAGGAAVLSGDVATFLPRLASTGVLFVNDAAASLKLIKDLTSDLAYIADRSDFNGLAAQLKSIRGFYGNLQGRFQNFLGLLYEPIVARTYGKANPGETLRIAVSDTDNLGKSSLDALFGRTIVEAKHGVSDVRAKQRLLDQLKTFDASNLADKIIYAVPTADVQRAINDFLKVQKGRVEELYRSGFISFQIISSPWKKD